MADQIVITEKTSQAKDVRAAVGFLGDDNLIRHEGSFGDWIRERGVKNV